MKKAVLAGVVAAGALSIVPLAHGYWGCINSGPYYCDSGGWGPFHTTWCWEIYPGGDTWHGEDLGGGYWFSSYGSCLEYS
jgi:hypothetical protein